MLTGYACIPELGAVYCFTSTYKDRRSITEKIILRACADYFGSGACYSVEHFEVFDDNTSPEEAAEAYAMDHYESLYEAGFNRYHLAPEVLEINPIFDPVRALARDYNMPADWVRGIVDACAELDGLRDLDEATRAARLMLDRLTGMCCAA